ncbi:MAG: TIGR01244 family sulfur transferase [Allosphingosinicella sp.]|uniref:TIGR01244 family sulfur transferase n=1 Tax=Allosphingosinicella sp. TaxID=2823234 RepID=UPI0039294565
MRQLDSRTFVSGQIRAEEIAALPPGIATIVNNRPDGEEPGQPPSAEIAVAAAAAGIAYRHIPVAGGFSEAQLAEMAELLEGPGGLLAFCKSGTRSTFLWALAEARRGADPDRLAEQAAAAGYDLAPIMGWLR